MHNAARHAEATRVVLGLAPQGRRWKLWVSDNGRGMRPQDLDNANGMGLSNIRQRAAEIGAELSWSGNGTGGTTVTLEFGAQDRTPDA
jgi:signal transduction histidine kinase